MSTAPICVFACSPRAGGNSDFMVHNFVQGVRGSGGEVEVTFLRDYTILPCNVCHSCIDHPDNRCLLSDRDDAEKLFRRMQAAPLVFIAAPIFFYHLPAPFKAFIDRAQCHWERREKARKQPGWTPNPAPRPGIAALVASRTRGDKLFEGSMLTLRYFFDTLDIRIMESCQLMGYDGPEELAVDGVACMRLYEMGAHAQAMVVENAGRKDA